MYDVFINFRGEDTRKTFTALLYEALCKENIDTYIDNDLDKGDDVWPSLAAAIRNSRISLLVFSENYASSKWCLVELAYILRCREQCGQVVIPVFYETDPADVRKQTGSHGRAFARHEAQITAPHSTCLIHPVTEWKFALTDAANISGWDSRNYRLQRCYPWPIAGSGPRYTRSSLRLELLLGSVGFHWFAVSASTLKSG